MLFLAIQRLGFLKPSEKLLLSDTVRDEEDLKRLGIRDLERLVCRNLSGRAWNPASLLESAYADAELFRRTGVRYLHRDDAAYPPLLRETCSPPFGLYLRGAVPDPERPAVAVVGTRAPTGKGVDAANALAAELSAAGFCVVSGLARGIDSAAHRGAARGPGGTCAVLPCGADRIYPQSNRSLAASILESGGSLLTEYPPNSDMHRYRFPERNRVIAGMARACVVVEAPAGSGALITADHALGEGRDLWVHAACLGSPRNAGADALAGQGAPVLGSARDLLEDWGFCERRPGSGAPAQDAPVASLRAGSMDGEYDASPGKDAARRIVEAMRADLGPDFEEGDGTIWPARK